MTNATQSTKRRSWRAWVAVALAIVATALIVPRMIQIWWGGPAEANSSAAVDRPKVELLKDVPNTLRVPDDVAQTLGLKTAEVQPYTQPRQLKLDGTLFIDPSSLARVHTRFAGEVIELGPAKSSIAADSPRLKFGDRVAKGQLLAVVWSKDLGEKKSELVDAILHRQLDEEALSRLQDLFQKGATPEQKLRDAQHNYEADLIAETRAERTLRSWRLSDAEIAAIKAEAESIRRNKLDHDPKAESNWSRVEVLSPIEGVIVELNVGHGDIVDTTLDLFKVADLSRLRVMCHVFEEDLPLLQKLSDADRRWTLRLGADGNAAPLRGGFERFDQIGRIVDPNTHTAQVLGWADNPDGRLLVGQFVTATIDVPPPRNLVAAPASAVIETGAGALVFVKRPSAANDTKQSDFERRRVALMRQGVDVVGVAIDPSAEEQKQGISSLRPGEVIVVDGALQLAGEMEDQQTGGNAN